MAFDEGLAERLRVLLAGEAGVREVRMFGGLCFMVGGNMACGIVGDELMVRVGAEAWPDVLGEPGVREMDFTGRPMKGMVYVGVEGLADDADLAGWVGRGVRFARSLPRK